MNRNELESKAQALRAQLWAIETQIRALDLKDAEEFRKMRDAWLNSQKPPSIFDIYQNGRPMHVGDAPGWWKYGATSQIGALQ